MIDTQKYKGVDDDREIACLFWQQVEALERTAKELTWAIHCPGDEMPPNLLEPDTQGIEENGNSKLQANSSRDKYCEGIKSDDEAYVGAEIGTSANNGTNLNSDPVPVDTHTGEEVATIVKADESDAFSFSLPLFQLSDAMDSFEEPDPNILSRKKCTNCLSPNGAANADNVIPTEIFDSTFDDTSGPQKGLLENENHSKLSLPYCQCTHCTEELDAVWSLRGITNRHPTKPFGIMDELEKIEVVEFHDDKSLVSKYNNMEWCGMLINPPCPEHLDANSITAHTAGSSICEEGESVSMSRSSLRSPPYSGDDVSRTATSLSYDNFSQVLSPVSVLTQSILTAKGIVDSALSCGLHRFTVPEESDDEYSANDNSLLCTWEDESLWSKQYLGGSSSSSREDESRNPIETECSSCSSNSRSSASRENVGNLCLEPVLQLNAEGLNIVVSTNGSDVPDRYCPVPKNNSEDDEMPVSSPMNEFQALSEDEDDSPKRSDVQRDLFDDVILMDSPVDKFEVLPDTATQFQAFDDHHSDVFYDAMSGARSIDKFQPLVPPITGHQDANCDVPQAASPMNEFQVLSVAEDIQGSDCEDDGIPAVSPRNEFQALSDGEDDFEDDVLAFTCNARVVLQSVNFNSPEQQPCIQDTANGAPKGARGSAAVANIKDQMENSTICSEYITTPKINTNQSEEYDAGDESNVFKSAHEHQINSSTSELSEDTEIFSKASAFGVATVQIPKQWPSSCDAHRPNCSEDCDERLPTLQATEETSSSHREAQSDEENISMTRMLKEIQSLEETLELKEPFEINIKDTRHKIQSNLENFRTSKKSTNYEQREKLPACPMDKYLRYLNQDNDTHKESGSEQGSQLSPPGDDGDSLDESLVDFSFLEEQISLFLHS